ncbi:MAG: TIGR03905 family TSCPD domain-containing protein [Muribaculaceae bacterium]|nr:TIGR03905 family TSCPD domain-containing protein [Muribaculaceae bacterium]MBQ5408928.1 TIGR03905 family TSCPD domain-containing protein [Muribaculaceae bacterium]MDY6293095.1 TIGR03905 family TSCPD domain-containing protein [Bacteroidales bacterium]MDY6412226.1 TIGR03905 family TSCPD domain-containing protein [Bacteroidales bacterium]
MKYTYNTWGTCSRLIDFEIQDGVIKNVVFTGGCNGNLQGIARLVEGMTPTQAISKLEGIHCGNKPTSCPDQLAQALKQALGS